MLHEDLCTFMIASRLILHRMRNVSDKSCRDKHTFYEQSRFFPLESRAVYEIIWENMEQPGRPQIPIQKGACTNMLHT